MSWLFALILTIGFAKLKTVALNRLLSVPQRKSTVVVSQLIHFVLIGVFFLILILRTGQHDVLEMVMIAWASFGWLLLIQSTVIYQLYAPPACQIANDSKVIDFRQSPDHQPWQQVLVGPRPMRKIALLPGNEQFQLEVSTKTYRLPRLPAEWNGLSIVHLTDTHFLGAVTKRYFEAVCDQAEALNPDLIAFTGDLTDDPALLSWLPETLGRLKAPLGQFFILGNHDWYRNVTEIRHEFARLGWTELASQSVELFNGDSKSPIIIAGDETPWMGVHPTLNPDTSDQFRILLSHTPDNITWARAHQIDVMLAGHTHGGQIRLPILGPIYSPSKFGCRYASGVFWLNPTLLYVSRGISGREPIRYLCRPELTKLVFVSEQPPI